MARRRCEYRVQDYGIPDAYGHRHKMSVAEAFVELVQARAGIETVVVPFEALLAQPQWR